MDRAFRGGGFSTTKRESGGISEGEILLRVQLLDDNRSAGVPGLAIELLQDVETGHGNAYFISKQQDMSLEFLQ